MIEKPHARPLYIDEASEEYAILAGAEKFFTDRDEKLRYGLVKRVFQWMLDTDENGFFEPMRARGERMDLRELFSRDMNTRYASRLVGRNRIGSSGIEMEYYIKTLERDGLRSEVDAMHDYVVKIDGLLPPEYGERRELIKESTEEEQSKRAARDEFRDLFRVRSRSWRISEKNLPPGA